MTMQPDFGATALDYAMHRAGFPDSLFERLKPFGVSKAGHSVVDLGTGTGTLARGFARRGCRVVGVDIADRLLGQARALDGAEGLEIEYRIARAERTGLPERCAEVVSAGQCWHWFDRAAVAAEVARILVPRGSVVIAYFDWLPLPGNVVEATESLIARHNAAWKFAGGIGVHPRCLRDLGQAGFREIESFSYDVAIPYTHEGWRGRIRASAGVGASLPEEAVGDFDRDLSALLAARFPQRNLEIPHRVFAVVARAPE
jgi:SAM-dependent methyltransferase